MSRMPDDQDIAAMAEEMMRTAKPLALDLMALTERHGPVTQAMVAMLFAVATAKNLAEAIGTDDDVEWASMRKTMDAFMRGDRGAMQ